MIQPKILLFCMSSLLLHAVLVGLLLPNPIDKSNSSLDFSVIEHSNGGDRGEPQPVAKKLLKNRDAISPPQLIKPPTDLQSSRNQSASNLSLEERAHDGGSAVKNLSSSEALSALNIQIVYPSFSRRAREQGRAEYELFLSQNLKLIQFKKIKSTGFERLDSAVDEGLKKLQALVTTEDSNGVFRRDTLIIDFRLKSSSSQAQLSAK